MAKQRRTLKPLPIDRAKWLTGIALKRGVVVNSKLRDSATGLQCCLGFLARKEGCSIKEITNYDTLESLTGKAEKRIIKALGISTWFTAEKGYEYDVMATLEDAMGANDNSYTSNKEREKRIKTILKELGYAVTFTGRYPKHLRD